MNSAIVVSCLLAILAVSHAQTALDIEVLNFALNLECLEAEFYSYAAHGHGIPAKLRGGGPKPHGGRKAGLSPVAQQLAADIAKDELLHVEFLRAALGSAAVPCPQINLGSAFAAAADAAVNGTLPVAKFNPYGDEVVFYHGAFIFEDVGVSAYQGAVGLLSTVALQQYASGILGTEAYHAGAIRSRLLEIEQQYVFPFGKQVRQIVNAIAELRYNVASGGSPIGVQKLVPGNEYAIVTTLNTTQVLDIVYLGSALKPGGFFPKGLNGSIK
jgi:hypothetical protein